MARSFRSRSMTGPEAGPGPRYSRPKGIGYFMNLLGKIDRWIERESKRGTDIPRFTQVQVRRIAIYLENHHLFNFDALRKVKGRARPRSVDLTVVSLHNVMMTGGGGPGPVSQAIGTLEAATGPAPVKGRRATWDDQMREFKRILKEQNEKLPAKVVDELV